jgi:hypothetical protein
LLNANQIVDATVVNGTSGSLSIPGPGDFFIEVTFSGSTTYVLNVGQNVPANGSTLPARTSDDFVPGELSSKAESLATSRFAVSPAAVQHSTEPINRRRTPRSVASTRYEPARGSGAPGRKWKRRRDRAHQTPRRRGRGAELHPPPAELPTIRTTRISGTIRASTCRWPGT